MSNPSLTAVIAPIVDAFVRQLSSAFEASVSQAVQSAFAGGAGIAQVKRGRGRPPKNAQAPLALLALAPAKPKKSRPKQFCPVPNCKGVAAPVFGMVCAKHKDMPKDKIKKFRDARRAKK